ncbi:hypothetical protein Tco_0533408 [Tanacetum coccineum]
MILREISFFLKKLFKDKPSEAKKLEIDLLIREPSDTFLMGDTEIKLNPLMDIDDPVPIPSVSEKPLDSLDPILETFDMTITNPLFDFDSEFTLNSDDPIFDIQNEESDESETETIIEELQIHSSQRIIMAGENIDNLTMEQYLTLTRGNQAPGVVKSDIDGNINFKIKSQFMRELREDAFTGNKKDDAHEHVERILDIVSLFNIPGVTHAAVMLRVFPITLTGAAKKWVDTLTPGTVDTWDLLRKAFIQRYCPLSKTAKQLEEIRNFKQEGDETLYQAWESTMNRQLLDAHGPIPGMTPAQALTAIQNMTDHSQKWHDGSCSKNISSNSNFDGIVAIISKLDNLGRDMKKLKENNQLPPKEQDPESFILPCSIGMLDFSNALADLGASISIMPFSMYKHPSDLRTEELHKPSLIDRGGPIAPTTVLGTDFVLKNHMVQLLRHNCQFHGFKDEDANEHLDKLISHQVNKLRSLAMTLDTQFKVLNINQDQKSIHPLSGNHTPSSDSIIASPSPSLTPLENSDFLLEEIDAFLSLDSIPPEIDNKKYLMRKEIFFCLKNY